MSKSRTQRCATLLALGILGGTSGSACALPYLTVGTQTSVGDGYFVTGQDVDEVYRVAAGPINVSSQSAWSGPYWPAPSTTIDSVSFAHAVANYGQLKAEGSYYGVGGASARAVFADQFTISNIALNGTAGDLYVTVSLHGILTGGASAEMTLGEECLSSGNGCRLTMSASGTMVGEFGFPIHFTYGAPLDIIVLLGAYTGLGGLSGSAFDLMSTGWISGLRLTDANGGLVSEYAMTSASGTDYGFGSRTNEVPEPRSAALAALAGALVVLARRRRQPHAS